MSPWICRWCERVFFGAATKATVLGFERIAHVDDRKAVAEHVADEGVALVHDDLHAVRPAALIAARHEADVFGAGAGRGAVMRVETIKLPV